MATVDEVETTLRELVARLRDLDPAYASLLPARRTIEATVADLGLTYHAHWSRGALEGPHPGPSARPHIRVWCESDDLLALASGELGFRQAYASNRLKVEASMTDLLRLRSVL